MRTTNHQLSGEAASNTHVSAQNLEPEYIRVGDAVRIFALSKPKLYELMGEGKVRYVSIRKRGQQRGTRLIVLESLRSFLANLEQGPKSSL